MGQVLLTVKEQKKVMGVDAWYEEGWSSAKNLCKAQLKKVVEWLEEHHCGHPDGVIPEVPLEVSYDDWQALLKEVE